MRQAVKGLRSLHIYIKKSNFNTCGLRLLFTFFFFKRTLYNTFHSNRVKHRRSGIVLGWGTTRKVLEVKFEYLWFPFFKVIITFHSIEVKHRRARVVLEWGGGSGLVRNSLRRHDMQMFLFCQKSV